MNEPRVQGGRVKEFVQQNRLVIDGQQHIYCVQCPVFKGLCPECGTFWIDAGSGQDLYGVRPVPRQAYGPNCYVNEYGTVLPFVLNNMANVICVRRT